MSCSFEGNQVRLVGAVGPDGGLADVYLDDVEQLCGIDCWNPYRLQQQEALGTLGVNLVFAAFHFISKPDKFVDALVESLKPGQVAIDMIRFAGPDTKNINNQRMNLELVRKGLAEAILFGPNEEILSVSDTIYGALVLSSGVAFAT